MAVILIGQITIVDLNDGKSINLYQGSNVAATQIFNKENSSYVPNWTVSPFLVLTPEVYVTGVATNQVSRLKGVPVWKVNGSTTLSTYGATAATSKNSFNKGAKAPSLPVSDSPLRSCNNALSRICWYS